MIRAVIDNKVFNLCKVVDLPFEVFRVEHALQEEVTTSHKAGTASESINDLHSMKLFGGDE